MSAVHEASGVVFSPVPSRRTSDEIIDQLRDRLRNNDLKPGDRLPPERQLAEQFQASRNTVREALRMMEVSGLIEIRKGATGGAFIAQGDAKVVSRSLSDMYTLSVYALSDLTEVRLWLGTLITRLACQRATEEDLSALRANVEQANELTEAGLWEQRAEVNHQFLNLLAAATANPIIAMLQHSITQIVREIVNDVGPLTDRSILDSRQRLMQHLVHHDEDAAVAEMEEHLRQLHRWWESAMRIRNGEIPV